MKKYLRFLNEKILLLAFIFFPFFSVFSTPLESDVLSIVNEYIEPQTWVILDVDNTLMRSSTQLGSAQWRSFIRKKAKTLGFNEAMSEEIVDRFWLFVQPFITVEFVDKNTRNVIQELQKEKIVVLALTARDEMEQAQTQKQLSFLKLSLENNFFPPSFKLHLPYPALYDEGVIYAGENKKGIALLGFMKQVHLFPKKIVFADDRLEQVEDVRQNMESLGIEFVGIRFSGADETVKAFNPKIADLQWSLLPKIVSDEQAKEMVKEE